MRLWNRTWNAISKSDLHLTRQGLYSDCVFAPHYCACKLPLRPYFLSCWLRLYRHFRLYLLLDQHNPLADAIKAFYCCHLFLVVMLLLYPTLLLIQMSKCQAEQGILKGRVSLYCWPPVRLVWNQLYDNLQFLFLLAKQTNLNQSNRRSMERNQP
jgi:hypothetical protein